MEPRDGTRAIILILLRYMAHLRPFPCQSGPGGTCERDHIHMTAWHSVNRRTLVKSFTA